jgi:glycerol-3-phosphate O-acyltransferase/dihydroxyacetone phosphate acyltransferase
MEPVRIVPCGMNYFHGHRFRSHVLVEFGKPIEVTEDLMELYNKDRREAYAALLKIVEQRLKSVGSLEMCFLFYFLFFPFLFSAKLCV